MFELEIMVAGYTVVVATTTLVISKCMGRNRINKISKELFDSRTSLLNAEAEIKSLKEALMKQGQS